MLHDVAACLILSILVISLSIPESVLTSLEKNGFDESLYQFNCAKDLQGGVLM